MFIEVRVESEESREDGEKILIKAADHLVKQRKELSEFSIKKKIKNSDNFYIHVENLKLNQVYNYDTTSGNSSFKYQGNGNGMLYTIGITIMQTKLDVMRVYFYDHGN